MPRPQRQLRAFAVPSDAAEWADGSRPSGRRPRPTPTGQAAALAHPAAVRPSRVSEPGKPDRASGQAAQPGSTGPSRRCVSVRRTRKVPAPAFSDLNPTPCGASSRGSDREPGAAVAEGCDLHRVSQAFPPTVARVPRDRAWAASPRLLREETETRCPRSRIPTTPGTPRCRGHVTGPVSRGAWRLLPGAR